MKRTLVIGTRGSALSLKQAEEVLEGLKRLHPDRHFEVRKIITKGDRNRKIAISRFNSKGVFVKELENHLQQEDIDIAVHSLKDMPSENPIGFSIAAVMPRKDPRDVLISGGNTPFESLPSGARLGSGSPRRAAQLKAIRPDVQFLDIRGNIDTRIGKVSEGQYDGVILAAAGLIRMGWQEQITEYFPVEACLPAVGQGALVVETRADDEETQRLVESLDHSLTRKAVEAERSFLKHMGGGCLAPMTAYGSYEDESLRLRGMAADPDGSEIIKAEVQGKNESSEELGVMLAQKLLSMGAADLVEAARI